MSFSPPVTKIVPSLSTDAPVADPCPGKAIDQATSSEPSCALVSPACAAVRLRVWLASMPKPLETTLAEAETARLSAVHISPSVHVAEVAA